MVLGGRMVLELRVLVIRNDALHTHGDDGDGDGVVALAAYRIGTTVLGWMTVWEGAMRREGSGVAVENVICKAT